MTYRTPGKKGMGAPGIHLSGKRTISGKQTALIKGQGKSAPTGSADFGSNTFIHNGVTYNSFANWLTGSGFTFANSTVKRYSPDATVSYAVNVARIQSGVFLYEPAGTNIVTNPDQASGWTAARATFTANATAAPDATTTAATLKEDATATNTHGVSRTHSVAITAQRYNYSEYYKQITGTRNISHIFLDSTFAHVAQMGVSLADGSINSAASVVGNFTSPIGSVTIGATFYRPNISFIGAAFSSFITYSRMASGTSTTYSGDNTSTVGTFGPQVEVAAKFGYFDRNPSTYMLSGTRAADILTPAAGTPALTWWFKFADGSEQQLPLVSGAIPADHLARPDIVSFSYSSDTWRIVAAHCLMSASLLATDAAKNTFESDYPIIIAADCTEIQFTADNKVIDATVDVTYGIPPTALTIIATALHNSTKTKNTPIKWDGGSAGTSIPKGMTKRTDSVFASSLGLTKFTRGEVYWVKMRGSVPVNTGQIPGGNRLMNNIPNAYSSRFDPTAGSNGTSQVFANGNMTAKTGEDSLGSPMSITAVIGKNLPDAIPSIVGIGDSIGDNALDTSGYALLGGAGFINRSAFDSNYAKPVPMINLARGSSTPARLAQDLTMFIFYFGFVNGMFKEDGTNQLTAVGAEPATEVADRLMIDCFKWYGFPNSKIIRTKCFPRPASTSDNLRTAAGQTLDSTFVTNTGLFHTYIDALKTAGVIDVVLPLAAARDPGNADKWITNGTDWYAAGPSDLIHPLTVMHTAVAQTEGRPAIEALWPGVTQ